MGVKKLFTTLFKSDDASAAARTEASAKIVAPVKAAALAPSRGKRAAATPKGDPTLLKRRWQTEKAVAGEGGGQYAFVVRKDANKAMVRSAFWALTGVRPVRVQMSWIYPKRSARGLTRRRAKKAIMTVEKGVTVTFPTEQTKTQRTKSAISNP